jgi:hypothetical protein
MGQVATNLMNGSHRDAPSVIRWVGHANAFLLPRPDRSPARPPGNGGSRNTRFDSEENDFLAGGRSHRDARTFIRSARIRVPFHPVAEPAGYACGILVPFGFVKSVEFRNSVIMACSIRLKADEPAFRLIFILGFAARARKSFGILWFELTGETDP